MGYMHAHLQWIYALPLTLRLAFKKNQRWGFPGGLVVGSLPANAGDAGLIPGLGGSHMLRSSKARAPQLLSLCSGAREPRLLKLVRLEPVLRNKRSHHNEKPTHRSEEWPPLAATREGPRAATKQRKKRKNQRCIMAIFPNFFSRQLYLILSVLA